ncbi:MAG: hypothetical protein GXO23_04100 [Crenarchaeota archaeon]|nr:hypothetical protein [Thermoproteota archaeon]
MRNRVLIYLDYGPSKKIITSMEKLIDTVEEDNRSLISALPYIVEVDSETRRRAIIRLAEAWAKLTGTSKLAEATVALIEQYRSKMIDDRKLITKIVRALSEAKHIEDISIMNVVLKIGLGKAFPDLGLLAIYEDPLSLEQGLRIGRIELPNTILRRNVALEYESKILKKIRKIDIEFVLIKKRTFSNLNIKIIDWRCLGVYPYNGMLRSVGEDNVELAEPTLCAYLRYNVDIITEVSPQRSVIVIYYRFPRSSSKLLTRLYEIGEILDKCYILCLPSSFSSRDLEFVLEFLKRCGIDVKAVVDVPVDVFLDMFLLRNS